MKLADQPVMSACVRAAESFNMTGIPDSNYHLWGIFLALSGVATFLSTSRHSTNCRLCH